jgi:hypothetical protein
LASLRNVRDDAALGRLMGAAGRRLVEQDYSVASVGPRLVVLMTELAMAQADAGNFARRAHTAG